MPFCIDEICSSNGGSLTINGSAPDYIELHNLTGNTISLDGYYVSDDEDHPYKFSLNGYSIPGNGFLILAADKKELPFKLSSSGEELFISDEDGNILQHVVLPPLEKDTTYSLQPDGSWHITEPTPMETNAAGTPYVKKIHVASPRFSHEAGFYDEPFDLEIEGYRTYRIYYTTDGSVPDENSIPYTGPIHIEDATSNPNTLSMRTDITVSGATPPSGQVKKATIIRAVAIDPDGNRSSEVTNSYFVGFQNYAEYQDIAVLSIVADPYDLFDEQDGIYVLGRTYQEWLSDENRNMNLVPQRIPANYRMHGREWEIPVSIQWFDEDNTLRLTQGAGVRIHGNWSRENPKKSFNLYSRNDYGSKTFQYDILDGSQDKEKLVIRSNLGKDSQIHALLRETGIPVSSYRPCLVFINGEFWGLYEIREKLDAADIAGFYGLDPNDLIVIKNKELDSGTEPEGTRSKGARAVYNDLISDVSNLDFSTPQGYETLTTIIDIDNYITYMAGLTYLNNSDYRNNFTMWRTSGKGSGEYEDARWRWIFQDLDYCCYYYDGLTDIVSYLPEDVFFSALWKCSTSFQSSFLTRVMDFANVELAPEYVKEFITPTLTYYNPYIKETYDRFPGETKPVSKPGTKEINNLMTFFNNRRKAVIEQLTNTFDLTCGTSKLVLADLTEGIGIRINGHQAHFFGDSWTGIYFTGCTVTFEAGDIPGFAFAGWYEDDELITSEQTVTVSTDTDHKLTPVYDELPAIVVLDDTGMIYSSGRYGLTRQLKNSTEECLIQVDESITMKRKYIDNTITFNLASDVKEPQGFTLSVPLHDYENAGVVFSIVIPENSVSLTWAVLCGNDAETMKEIPADYVKFSGGLLRIEFSIPEEQLEKGKAVIRLEAGAEESRASFTLHGFRIYGTAMENPPVRTQEKLRTQDTVAAETATVSAEKPEEKTELKVETAAGVNLLTEPVASTGTEREELEGMQQIQGIEEQSDFNLTIILAIYVCVSFSILAAGTALVIFFIRKRK